MRILELLRIFRIIANLPNFADKASVRQWLLNLCDIAGLLTERTPTPADDAVLAFLERSIADPKRFDPIYDMLIAMLAAEPGAPVCMASPELAALAEASAVAPTTVFLILEALVAIVNFIRERRGK